MKKLLFLSLAATLWLSSCSQETILSNENLDGQVVFTGNMAQLQTRVNGNSWNGGDQVGIYMIKSTPGTLAAANIITGYGNKAYTASVGATTTFTPVGGTDMYYPNDGSNVKFLAYHPYNATVPADFKLPINLSVQTNQSAIDVLYAPITATDYNKTTATPVPLNFTHKLVKLIFNITNASGTMTPVANGITVGIPNQYTTGTLDLTDGLVSHSGGTMVKLNIASTLSGTTVTAEAIVFPEAAGMEVSFTNSTGQLFTATIPHSNWVAGNLYTYTVTLSAAVHTVASITGAITDWNDVGNSNISGIEKYDISWYTGPGPYFIDNADKLAGLAYLVNSGTTDFNGKTINLDDNIDLTGLDWVPIGKGTHPFKGAFDGNGYEINGLTITMPTTNFIGLFGNIVDGTVKNLGILNADILGNISVGCIAGKILQSTISDCYVSGQIEGKSDIGGIVGTTENSIVKDCYAMCDVNGDNNYVGGIAGYLHATTLTYCYATGTVSGARFVGGIAGFITINSSLSSCVALNAVVSYNGTGTAQDFGRIVGAVFASSTLSENLAFDGILGATTLFTEKTQDGKDGKDMTKTEAINQSFYSFVFHPTNGPWKWGTTPYTLPVLIWQTNMPAFPTHLN